MRDEHYVKPLMRGSKVRGYAVCRDIGTTDNGGLVTKQVQGFYDMTMVKGTPIALYLANQARDDLNKRIE